MRLAIACVCLLGCDLVFRIPAGVALDATPGIDVPLPDGPGIVTPPPGPTACLPPPDFEALTYDPVNLQSDNINDLNLYRDGGVTRVLMIIATNDGEKQVLDVDLTGGDVRHLVRLDPPTAVEITALSPMPDGSVIWLKQQGAAEGLFYATRDSGFAKQPTPLAFVDPFDVVPGTPAFHDGTLRMVVSVTREFGNTAELVELQSPNGLAWTELDTVELDLALVPGILSTPSLSSDGCLLLFSTTGVNPFAIYVVARTDQGRFVGRPTKLVKASSSGFSIVPSMDPEMTSMWLIDNGDPIVPVRGQ